LSKDKVFFTSYLLPLHSSLKIKMLIIQWESNPQNKGTLLRFPKKPSGATAPNLGFLDRGANPYFLHLP
jgi:hypothetical protein